MESLEAISKKIQKLENEVETLKSISNESVLNREELEEFNNSLEEYKRGEVFTLEDIEKESTIIYCVLLEFFQLFLHK